MKVFHIIVRDGGVDRTYPCTGQGDAIVLFDALCRVKHHVEWWDGTRLVQEYKNC